MTCCITTFTDFNCICYLLSWYGSFLYHLGYHQNQSLNFLWYVQAVKFIHSSDSFTIFHFILGNHLKYGFNINLLNTLCNNALKFKIKDVGFDNTFGPQSYLYFLGYFQISKVICVQILHNVIFIRWVIFNKLWLLLLLCHCTCLWDIIHPSTLKSNGAEQTIWFQCERIEIC